MKTKILQFGEGNFLRCYIDWMVQRMNDHADFDGMVQIIQPRGTELNNVSRKLNEKGGLYHTCLRGLAGGRQLEEIEEIRCVRGVDICDNLAKYAADPDIRFVFSNTTEAGIEYIRGAKTFPCKVFGFLKERFKAGLPGLVFIPCELIEDNGEALKTCILRYADDAGADDSLKHYITDECVFCSTLVDRIVSGRPPIEDAARYAAQIGEDDEVLVCGEPFHFLAIETGPDFDLEAELPLKRAGINIVYTHDLRPYRIRKLRFLNAVHTTAVYWGLERGFGDVAEIVADKEGLAFLKKVIFEEIYPTVDLPDAEKMDFADSVIERFANPFAHHKLTSIALNSLAKWKTRCLPIVCDFFRLYGRMPECMMEGYDSIARHYDGKH